MLRVKIISGSNSGNSDISYGMAICIGGSEKWRWANQWRGAIGVKERKRK